MPPIKVGIVGYGFAAKSFHIPFITAIPDYEMVAILQRTKAPTDLASAPKGSHCLVDHPTIQHHTSADSFFAAPEIEFVVIASRIDTHAFFAEKALEAGKHGKWTCVVLLDSMDRVFRVNLVTSHCR
jgi:predicted dehydrogenase